MFDIHCCSKRNSSLSIILSCSPIPTTFPFSILGEIPITHSGNRWPLLGKKFRYIVNSQIHLDEIFDLLNASVYVQVTCQGSFTCQFDYITTGRRENGLDTLDAERKFEGLKYLGERKRITLFIYISFNFYFIHSFIFL